MNQPTADSGSRPKVIGTETWYKAILERSRFLPEHEGIKAFIDRSLPAGAAWHGARDFEQHNKIAAFATALPTISSSDLQQLSSAVDSFIEEIQLYPLQHANSLAILLRNTEMLNHDQITSLFKKLINLNRSINRSLSRGGLPSLVYHSSINLQALDNSQRDEFIQLIKAKHAQPGNDRDVPLKASALATLATHPDPSERSRLHQQLIATHPDRRPPHNVVATHGLALQEWIRSALEQTRFASAAMTRMLLDHLATTPFPAGANANTLLGSGTELGELLCRGIETGRPGMAAMLADFAIQSNLPDSEIETMLTGGQPSVTPVWRRPLTVAINIGSIKQMNEWKEAVRQLKVPPVAVERMLAQQSRGGLGNEYAMSVLEYLMSRSEDWRARPALVAYGDMLPDLGLDAAAQTRLLSARGTTGLSPLYTSIQHNRTDLVRTFGQVLASGNLPPANLQQILTPRSAPSAEHPNGRHLLDDPALRDALPSVKALVDLTRALPLPAEAAQAIVNFTPDARGRLTSTGVAGSHAATPLVWGQRLDPQRGDTQDIAALKTALNKLYEKY